MKVTTTIALAAVLAMAAAPALADEWIYHGGPKSPDSLTWYGPDHTDAARPVYGRSGPAARYRCDPATSDCDYPRGR